MKHLHIYILLTLISALNLLCAPRSQAQTVANDTIRFSTENILMEDDPNNHEYCFTLFSPDGKWKMQLDYHADSMFGTFTNDDFDLQGSGKYYNFVRNPQNDMQFYTFTDMEVTVSDEVTHYRIDANCLASNKTRFLVEGTIPVLVPTDTIEVSLGYTSIVHNAFFDTYTFHAENEEFMLDYGIVSPTVEGTFYRADLLKPELLDKQSQTLIEVANATAVHTVEGETTHLTLDLLSSDLKVYHLVMYNAPLDIEIVDEVEILITSNIYLQDLTQMYGCYQWFGMNDEYQVAIAMIPEALESGQTHWTMEDIFMPYTNILHTTDNQLVSIYNIEASLIAEDELISFVADVTSYEGILYHVKMVLNADHVRQILPDSAQPRAKVLRNGRIIINGQYSPDGTKIGNGKLIIQNS